MDELRKRFEKWWLDKHPGSQFNDLKRAGQGYEKGWLDDCWDAWQKSAAQPVPAEGAQAEYERGVENTTKFYLEREDKQRERYDALYALKLGGNIFALDLQKRLEQVNESFKLIAAAIAPPVTAAPAGLAWNGPQGHLARCKFASGNSYCNCGWLTWCNRNRLPQSAPAEGAQAWLIERPGPEWATCWSGGFDWTKDSLKAIRFCRREDANQVAELFEFEDVRITEHTWE